MHAVNQVGSQERAEVIQELLSPVSFGKRLWFNVHVFGFPNLINQTAKLRLGFGVRDVVRLWIYKL